MTPAAPLEFPALRGKTFGREAYSIQLPLELGLSILVFRSSRLPRQLQPGRLPDRERTAVFLKAFETRTTATPFPPIVVAVNKPLHYVPSKGEPTSGKLIVPAHSAWIVQHGDSFLEALFQHCSNPPKDCAGDSLAVTIYFEPSIAKLQAGFRLLQERGAISRTRKALITESDAIARISRSLAVENSPFAGVTELHKSTLSPRSKNLFTLSAIYLANRSLLVSASSKSEQVLMDLAHRFWRAVDQQFPEWDAVRRGEMASGELRAQYLHAHAVILHALGRIGSCLQKQSLTDFTDSLAKLSQIDWRRSNPDWEGRALLGGRASNTTANVLMTLIYLKRKIGLKLMPEEIEKEKIHARSHPRT